MDSTIPSPSRPKRVGGSALVAVHIRKRRTASRTLRAQVSPTRLHTKGPRRSAWSRLTLLRTLSPSGPKQYVPVRVHNPGYEISKRLFDFGVCLLILPLVLFVMAVCGLFLYLEDPGPIFFRQMRTGKGGKRFGMFKLRTMVTNAEELKQKYQHLNELTWPDFKITDDPRVTRVGKCLRKTSLDELPQIFNVLIGQMSLVGPRPTSFSAETYELWHTERLEVVPGITGLWQISGRSDIDFADRILLDVAYIENRTFLGDLAILWATARAIFGQKGAY